VTCSSLLGRPVFFSLVLFPLFLLFTPPHSGSAECIVKARAWSILFSRSLICTFLRPVCALDLSLLFSLRFEHQSLVKWAFPPLFILAKAHFSSYSPFPPPAVSSKRVAVQAGRGFSLEERIAVCMEKYFLRIGCLFFHSSELLSPPSQSLLTQRPEARSLASLPHYLLPPPLTLFEIDVFFGLKSGPRFLFRDFSMWLYLDRAGRVSRTQYGVGFLSFFSSPQRVLFFFPLFGKFDSLPRSFSLSTHARGNFFQQISRAESFTSVTARNSFCFFFLCPEG